MIGWRNRVVLMRFFFGLALSFLVLSGCKSEDDVIADENAGLCGAAQLQDRVGQPFAGTSFDAAARIIRPNTAVTQDYRVERLNVELDENDIITRIACG